MVELARAEDGTLHTPRWCRISEEALAVLLRAA